MIMVGGGLHFAGSCSAFGFLSDLGFRALRNSPVPFSPSSNRIPDPHCPKPFTGVSIAKTPNSMAAMNLPPDTHSKLMGYLLWIFGFTGAHRFYYGRPITGTIWFFTFGLFLVGWLIDLFLIPWMDRKADLKYKAGPINYSVAWLLLTFLGLLGIHRFYMRKWITGVIYLLTVGIFGLGYLYDYWTLNSQINELNRSKG
jgi:TM2 domain-containing membrane protein YozV